MQSYWRIFTPQDESVKGVEALVLTEAAVVTPPVTPRSLPQPLSLSGAKYLATRVLGFAGRELGSVVYSLSACCLILTSSSATRSENPIPTPRKSYLSPMCI